MALTGFYEHAGTHGDDYLVALQGNIVYGGPGNDQIALNLNSHAYLIGGSGNDTYILGRGSYAVVLDSGGHDTITVPFNITPWSTYAVSIDGGRHLLLGDFNTGTMVLIEDSRKHPIESFNFNGLVTTQFGMESAIRTNGMHLGDVSYQQMSEFAFGTEEFWSLGMQAEIDSILSREAELFGQSPGASPAPQPAPPAPAPEPAPAAPNNAFVNEPWYLSQNPDVAAAGINATTHYMNWGWREGRDPNFMFDTDWYLTAYQDVAAAGLNPLEHYMNFGWREGRDPSTSFDTTRYLDTHVDVALAGMNPLEHYLNWGISEGREIAAVV